MNAKQLFEAFARAIGLYFVVSAAVTLISYFLNAEFFEFDQLVGPVVTVALGVFLLLRGDLVSIWAFRNKGVGGDDEDH